VIKPIFEVSFSPIQGNGIENVRNKGEIRLEKYIGTNKWRWIQLKQNGRESVQPAIEQFSFLEDWLKHIHKSQSNYLKVDCMGNGEKVVKGSLIYQKSFSEKQDYEIFHFYLTKDRLVTVNLELSLLKQINPEVLGRLIDRTENAVDGFLVYIGALLNDMLMEIDQFEEKHNKLIWSIQKRNETGILDRVYHIRHELLLWKNLLIPIKELIMAIEETNFHGINKGEIFDSVDKRMERTMVLLNEYEHEMDSIINMEEVISSHRGNEIMKTLTVITTVFTPIMAFGALWGMNFEHMPEIQWRFGYLLSITLIIISTLLLYIYLKIKGWTGDLLKGKKNDSFFK
jgi:magnesium transporter